VETDSLESVSVEVWHVAWPCDCFLDVVVLTVEHVYLRLVFDVLPEKGGVVLLTQVDLDGFGFCQFDVFCDQVGKVGE